MRNPALDVLRLWAVVLVLGRHFDESLISDDAILTVWRRGGWVGVDLFFVLSGYLISGLIFDEQMVTGRFSAGKFLLRRAFKIYPAFWALIGFTIAWRLALLVRDGDGQSSMALSELAAQTCAELLFVQNYWVGLWNHTWSLAVEEHFYVGLALLTAWLAFRKPDTPFRSLPIVFGLCAAACLLLRMWAASRPAPLSYYDTVFPTHLRIDSLMFGVVVRQACDAVPALSVPSIALRISLICLGAACLVPAFMIDPVPGSTLLIFGFPLFSFGAACLVVSTRGIMLRGNGPPSPVALLALAGACSYSTYLWHMPVEVVASRVTVRWLDGSCTAYLFLYIGGSLLAGAVMFKAVEKPVLRMRDRWVPSPRTAVTRT